MKEKEMTDKVIVVTGASRGLGKISAVSLAKRGHRVFAAIRNTNSANNWVVEELQALKHNEGLNIEAVEMDATNQESVNSAIDSILANSHIDVLVNNVGIMNVGITEAYSVSELKTLFDTNVFSMARVTQSVLPHMRSRRQGLLVHISSLAGRVVLPFFGAYCASKFALEALAETYKYELAKFGIDSVIVEPGPHRTNLIDNTPQPKGNTSVLSDYEDHLELSENIRSTFKEFQECNDVSDPESFARAMVHLIETESSRPLRTVVGADFGVRDINAKMAPLQERFMQGLHLEDML